MKKVEIILLNSEQEYRDLYIKELAQKKIFLADILVLFDEKSFDHIFYEPSNEEGRYIFSQRRAKRMLFIEPILSGKIEGELMFEPSRGTFAIFCKELECVIYLRHREGTGGLQIGSFFDFGKDHNKMLLKQKKKCEPITFQELKQKIKTPFGEGADSFGPTTP